MVTGHVLFHDSSMSSPTQGPMAAHCISHLTRPLSGVPAESYTGSNKRTRHVFLTVHGLQRVAAVVGVKL